MHAFSADNVKVAEEQTGLTFNGFPRFSDGCGAQYKSQFCLADLTQVPQDVLHLENNLSSNAISFHYFASHEGKSESDSLGALDKLDASRMILKNPHLVINGAEEYVFEITKYRRSRGQDQDNFASATEKFSFR